MGDHDEAACMRLACLETVASAAGVQTQKAGTRSTGVRSLARALSRRSRIPYACAPAAPNEFAFVKGGGSSDPGYSGGILVLGLHAGVPSKRAEVSSTESTLMACHSPPRVDGRPSRLRQELLSVRWLRRALVELAARHGAEMYPTSLDSHSPPWSSAGPHYHALT